MLTIRDDVKVDFLHKRIGVICSELKRLSVRQSVPVTDWMYRKGKFLHPQEADQNTDGNAFEKFDSSSMRWYGKDEHYWFRSTCRVPDSFEGKQLWLKIHTQIDEWDDGRNPQFLLFIDGEAAQGIDMTHREVLLTKSAKAATEYRLDLQAYTGILHAEFSLIVEMLEIDPEIIGLYYDLAVPLEAFPRLEQESRDSRARADLEKVLNEAVNLIDLRTPYNQEFSD